MTQIIRVEHADGIGMFLQYNPEIDLDSGFVERPHSVRFICPELSVRHFQFNNPKDDGLDIQSDQYCAYKSIEQIQQWIKPHEFKILFDNGYKVLLIEVSECETGRDQIIYRKTDVISIKDISSLFK